MNMYKINSKVPFFLRQEYLNNSTKSLNKVQYSFNVEECKKMYFKTVEYNQINEVLSGAGIPLNNPEEDIKNFKTLMIETGFPSVYVSVTESTKEKVKEIMQDISCISNIEIKEVDHIDEDIQYSIAICNVEKDILYDALQYIGLIVYGNKLGVDDTSPITDRSSIIYDRSLITLDGRVDELIDNKNTIAHEIGHAFRISHPIYKNISEQKKYRSVLENGSYGGEDDTPIHKICRKISKTYNENAKCVNLPAKYQPIDVRGIQESYGYSHNKSDYCKNYWDNFKLEFKELVEPYNASSNEVNDDL